VKRPTLDQTAGELERTTQKKKKKPKMQLTRFYCSKCGETSADHQYKQCPTWRSCRYCDQEGHWSFHCPTPHVKCTQYHCGVDVGHRNIGNICPWSKEVKLQNFRYECDGQIVDLDHARQVYREELDWHSHRLSA
jgi:hypothetical protein